jgi:hypothetical protein
MITTQEHLAFHIKTSNTHARRLQGALKNVKKLMPITADTLANLSDNKMGQIDMLSGRFSKLQDLIGAKIFPIILEIHEVEEFSFKSRLTILNQKGFLDDITLWLHLRDLRNDLTHDYPDDDEETAKCIAKLLVDAQALLTFWEQLKPKLENLQIPQSP